MKALNLKKKNQKNGQLRNQGLFTTGKRTGEWKFYYDNGKLKEVGQFILGKRKGKWKLYDREGQETFKEYK